MKRIDRLWGHIVMLCLASGFVGVAIGAIISDGTSNFREWAGALSGWAAFIVGVPTVYFLAKQLQEQRRVTRFTTGDIQPDFFQSGNEMDRLSHFTLVNNNRRDLILLELKATAPTNITCACLAPRDHNFTNGRFTRDITVSGWSNRSTPPERFRFVVAFFDDGADGNEYLGDVTVEVRFRYRDSEEVHALSTFGNIDEWTQRRNLNIPG